MDYGSDVLRTLRWGLRRYAWVMVLFIVALGAVLPLLQARTAEVYETSALIQPKSDLALSNADALPKWGEGIFTNGAVAREVRATLDLPAGTPVIPENVELVSEQDSVLFNVIGRHTDPKTAQEIANNAASILALEMSSSAAVGTFTVQHAAEVPTSPLPEVGGRQALILAPIAGGIVGLGIVLLILVVRQPVLDPGSAQLATGAPVLGTVVLPHRRRDVDAEHAIGIAGVARRLLAGPSNLILFASSPQVAGVRRQLLSVLVEVIGQARGVQVLQGGDTAQLSGYNGASGGPAQGARDRMQVQSELIVVDQPTTEERTVRAQEAMTVLVAKEGTSLNALREAATEYLDGDPMGVVLVRRQRRTVTRWRRRSTHVGEHAAGGSPELVEPEEEESFFDSVPETDDVPARSR